MRKARVTLVVTLCVLAVAAAVIWEVRSLRQVRRVGDTQFYRSGQPDYGDLADMSQRIGLKTVVNLRGPNPDADWYVKERESASKLGLELVDLPFETFDAPPRIEVLSLLDALTSDRRPVLLHCESGIDRSGWAAGFARLVAGESLDVAESELAHRCSRDTCPLHAFFDSYRTYLRSRHLETRSETFQRWVRDEYYPEPYRARVREISPAPRVVDANSSTTIEVEITNEAARSWTTHGETTGIRPGARLLGPFDQVPDNILDIFRSPGSPDRDVFRDHWQGVWKPGESRTIAVSFDAPAEPGLWVAQIDLVDEQVHWFSDLGGPGLLVTFRVVDRGPVARNPLSSDASLP